MLGSIMDPATLALTAAALIAKKALELQATRLARPAGRHWAALPTRSAAGSPATKPPAC
jgi:hypothetical protein